MLETVPTVLMLENVAESLKFWFTPASDLPLRAMTLRITTVRLNCFEQLPHERYSLPKLSTKKFWMIIVPGPLCWNTLSEAALAPPPSMVITWLVLLPFKVAASSPTSSHHTFLSVHVPLQWMPSWPRFPMITFWMVEPAARSKIGAWLSLWLPLLPW